MNQAFGVNGGQRAAQVDADAGRLRGAHAPVLLDQLMQRTAGHELEREPDAVFAAVHRVDAHDVRMIHARQSARLLEEVRAQLGPQAHMVLQHLDRHLALQHRVDRAIDGPEASPAQHLAELELCIHVRPRAVGERHGKRFRQPVGTRVGVEQLAHLLGQRAVASASFLERALLRGAFELANPAEDRKSVVHGVVSHLLSSISGARAPRGRGFPATPARARR